jgi:two-component system, cell cycle response regulator
MDTSGTRTGLARACWWAVGAVMVVYVLQMGTDVLGESVTDAFQDYLYNALLFVGGAFCVWRAWAVRDERVAWLVIGAGILSTTAADIVWTVAYAEAAAPPYPSIADGLWLVYYPAACVTIVLLVRSRIRGVPSSLWLDGMIGALTTAAVASAVLYGPIVRAGAGDLSAAVVTNLAYPIGDLLLLGIVVAVFGLSGWRPGRAWLVLGVGLAFNAVADGIYLFQTAEGTYQEGSLLDAMWPSSALLVGLAAWQPVRRESAPSVHHLRVVLVPFACGVVGIGLLVYDDFSPLNRLAVALTAATLLLVLVRTAYVFSENQRMLRRSHKEARTDPLTGLRNRRSLMDDLEEDLPLATPAYPRALILFDLDGFKEYNDTFGHPAGDGLLARLGEQLAEAVGGHGHAYRLGGDEFCALLRPGLAGVEPLTGACVAALTEHGEGFDVTSSYGTVLIPDETTSATEALQLADRRMYAQKGAGRMSAGKQSRDVLMSTLSERQPKLHEHLRDTAELALSVGRELGMTPEQLDEVARAAELHDVGKIAIPDAILEKPGPLDETEWSFMRRHTIIGERILLSAPALRPVARLVRSSHEHWDGSGYPDALAGEQIPLGARVVAVCDAFDAMTTDRPYRARIDPASAIEELRRCAGSQFDPEVVDAFTRVLRRDAAAA